MYSIAISSNNAAAVWRLSIDEFDKWECIQDFILDQIKAGMKRVYVTAWEMDEDVKKEHLFYESFRVDDDIDSYYCMNMIRGRVIDKVHHLRELYV